GQDTRASRSERKFRAASRRRAKAIGWASKGHEAVALFAYGTLRRGASMYRLLEGRTTWIGSARAAGRLLDLGAFPGLVPAIGPARGLCEIVAVAAALARYPDRIAVRVVHARERLWNREAVPARESPAALRGNPDRHDRTSGEPRDGDGAPLRAAPRPARTVG